MKMISTKKFHLVNAAVWAICIVASTFVVQVLKEPDMLLYVLLAGYFATSGLVSNGGEKKQE